MNSPLTPKDLPDAIAKTGQPLAYLEGFAYFYGRKFLSSPAALIPRPETEDIIRISTSRFSSRSPSILDLGTGSGIIAITLALELGDASITAVDLSEPALDLARNNATLLGADNITFLQSNLFKNVPGKYDLICANLPYVDKSWPWLDKKALDFEPSLALYAEDNGLALINKCITEAPTHLNPGAHLLLEADPSQHKEIIAHAIKHNYRLNQIKNYIIDLSLIA